MKHPQRVTVRSLARELGVSAVTVSRALRGTGEVRTALAAKITRLANRRGYKADPAVAAVLGTLRQRSERAYLETVAFVWTHERSSADAEYQGACEQAERLGYRVEPVRPWEQRLTERDVTRILRARGIRGVLLSPNHASEEPRYDLDWTELCPVLIGSSLRNTGITRVQRDYFNDARLALERLQQNQHDIRVGLALGASVHRRTQRQYEAAFLVHSGLPAATAARLVHVANPEQPPAEQRKAFERWLRSARPDVVLADLEPCAEWLRTATTATSIGYAGLALGPKDAALAGIRPDFRRIGAEAMRVLYALLRSRHSGLLASPMHLHVPGTWQGVVGGT